MKKKGWASLLTVAVSCWLSVTGTVNAEDKIYYGQGDGNNTGNISNVNWTLNSDYSYFSSCTMLSFLLLIIVESDAMKMIPVMTAAYSGTVLQSKNTSIAIPMK